MIKILVFLCGMGVAAPFVLYHRHAEAPNAPVAAQTTALTSVLPSELLGRWHANGSRVSRAVWLEATSIHYWQEVRGFGSVGWEWSTGSPYEGKIRTVHSGTGALTSVDFLDWKGNLMETWVLKSPDTVTVLLYADQPFDMVRE